MAMEKSLGNTVPSNSRVPKTKHALCPASWDGEGRGERRDEEKDEEEPGP